MEDDKFCNEVADFIDNEINNSDVSWEAARSPDGGSTLQVIWYDEDSDPIVVEVTFKRIV